MKLHQQPRRNSGNNHIRDHFIQSLKTLQSLRDEAQGVVVTNKLERRPLLCLLPSVSEADSVGVDLLTGL